MVKLLKQLHSVQKLVDNSKTINGHKFVDLGLPSGLLWAETNIGAETAADYGDYFAWGETHPKSDYGWSTYKYGESSYNLTKYNFTDCKSVLDMEDDAAYVNWGASCRMPTKDDLEELFNSDICVYTWISMITSSNSCIDGYKITSTKTGNSIFLPASGIRIGEYLGNSDSGFYWSSSLSDVPYADIRISTDSYGLDHLNRCYGHTVRPVAEP